MSAQAAFTAELLHIHSLAAADDAYVAGQQSQRNPRCCCCCHTQGLVPWPAPTPLRYRGGDVVLTQVSATGAITGRPSPEIARLP